MDSDDVVDEVNALLKLGVGDSYRLEHIKQAYIQNKTIWVTDENYLKRMREKYLVTQNSDLNTGDIVFENESEDEETIHCWKCGKKVSMGANFCMACGTSLFEIGSNSKSSSKPKSTSKSSKSIPLKIPLLVGIPVLLLVILGAGYTQGYFGNFDTSTDDEPAFTTLENEEIFYGEFNSKCGAGTVLDPETNLCRVGEVKPTDSSDVASSETNSKCGPGSIFDSKTNSCIVG